MFFARMLGILSYQTLASLSNMLMMKIFGVMMLLHFLKDGDNARLVSRSVQETDHIFVAWDQEKSEPRGL